MTSQVIDHVSRSQFTEAMAWLASGLAVITTDRESGQPCGLLVSAISSYSVRPPSVLVSIGEESGSFTALLRCEQFGVHLLGNANEPLARVFAAKGGDKFARVDWRWDNSVPRLLGVPAYLRCTRAAVFRHADHAVLIGALADLALRDDEPLVYHRHRLDWRLCAPRGDGCGQPKIGEGEGGDGLG